MPTDYGPARAARPGLAYIASALILMVVMGLFNPGFAQAHHAPSLPAINVQPPLSGTWDRFNVAGPAIHHIPFGKEDWSVDVYQKPDYTVRVRAWPVSQQGAVQYRIADVKSACKNPNVDGGSAVKVEFHYAGHYVGWAWYAHLANVQVHKDEWVKHAAVLGYTKKFPESSCYDVQDVNGVHVHFELGSNRHFACYIPRPAGAWMNYWGVIGRIGGDFAHQTRSACP